MRVWTDGSTHLVLGPKGLTRYSKGKAETIPLGEGAPVAKGGGGGWHARGILAVDEKAKTAWVEWAGKLREVKLDGSAPPRALEWKAKDLAIAGDGLAVAVVDAEKGKGKIVSGPIPADGKWKKTLAVPEPIAVKWPAGVVWAKGVKPPWSRKKEPGHDAYLSSNAYGVALAERSSGIVAVLRPGKDALEFAVRVPTQDEADVTAAATEQGVLIVLCIEGRNSAVVHVDKKGKILATLANVQTELEEELAWGLGPPVLVSATKAFLVHEYTIPQVLDLKLPDLAVESTWELPATTAGEKSTAAGADGKNVLLGFGGEVWMLTRTGSGWQLDELGAGADAGSGGTKASRGDDIGDDDLAAMLKMALGGGRTKPGAGGKGKAAAPAADDEDDDADADLPDDLPDEDFGEIPMPPEPAATEKKKAATAKPKVVDDDDYWRERQAAAESEAPVPGGRKKGKLVRADGDPTADRDEDVEEDEEDLGLADEDVDPDDEAEGAAAADDDGDEGGRPSKPVAEKPAGVLRRPSIEGEPALTLVANPGGPKQWTGKPGQPFTIEVGFGNVGGATKGFYVEVDGSPVGGKKVVPKAVRVGETRVAFAEPKGNKARVEIKDLPLQAGMTGEKPGQPPVPSQVVTLTLELDAPASADDLLMVRIGPLRVLRPGAGAFTHGKRLLIS